MRTRRQAKLQKSNVSVSPMKKKEPRGGKKQKAEEKKDVQPSKRTKKQQNKSPSPQPQKKENKRGRKKKQERVQQKSKSNEKKKQVNKSGKKQKRESAKKQKQDKKQDAKKIKQTKEDKKQNEEKKRKTSKKQRSRSKSPSPIKKNSKDKVKSQSPVKPDQIKKVIVKGAAPVDEYFDKGKDFHVLVHDTKVYSATLNQSNVSHNNNKYYNLQILQSDKDPNVNYFLTRWGRVGTPGQKSILGPYTINVAIRQYNTKFREKHIKGEYRELELNFGDDEAQADANGNDDQTQNQNKLSDYQQSKLTKPLKDLINLIFDLGMMNKQMTQIGYNVKKMPLGKLSKENIKKGYNILKELYDEVNNKKREDIIQKLTNDFYSYIPHDVGFQSMRLFKLDNPKKVKEKLQMLQSLSEIKIATQLLSNKEQGNKIDNNYKKLNRQIEPIDKDSFSFKLINDYLQSTHAITHRNYDLELIDLFQLHSDTEKERYMKDVPNKMLLWHGSRLTNFVGILSQGLRIAPPEAPVTGYMFGKGVYFADMSSKSANYCFTNPDNNIGILLLCEVALGNCNEKMHADYYASNLPDGKHSTKGLGRTAPKQQNYQTLDGAIIPMGPGFENNTLGYTLQYNEFIVYNINQIKIKYLLRVKFNYKRR